MESPSSSRRTPSAKTLRLEDRQPLKIDHRKSQPTFNSLPDAILEEIFAYLDVKQRIRIERVCKRWRAIGKDKSWAWPRKFNSRKDLRDEELSDDIFLAILNRCGKTLQSLSVFADKRHCKVTALSVELIAKHCPNLTDIILSDFPTTTESLKLLGQKCTKLKSADMRDSIHPCKHRPANFDDARLTSFIKECTHLESLTIFETFHLTGECLANLNEKITAFQITSSSVTPNSMERLTERCPSLTELKLKYCNRLEETIPKLFYKYAATLKVLHMEGFENYCTCFEPVFHHLEVLSMEECTKIDDNFMGDLTKKCKKLQVLNVMKCYKLTEDGLAKLASLPCLKILDISFIRLTTGAGVEAIAEQGMLEKLTAIDTHITNRNCNALAAHCSKLSYLNVAGSAKITNRVVDAFREGLQSGFIKGPVYIWAYGTFVKKDVKICEGLKVDIGDSDDFSQLLEEFIPLQHPLSECMECDDDDDDDDD